MEEKKVNITSKLSQDVEGHVTFHIFINSRVDDFLHSPLYLILCLKKMVEDLFDARPDSLVICGTLKDQIRQILQKLS